MLRHLRENEYRAQYFTCSIIDLSISNNSTLDISGQDIHNYLCLEEESASRLFQDLRKPSASVALRVVLWKGDRSRLSSTLLDVCGLGLDIDAHYFEFLAERMTGLGGGPPAVQPFPTTNGTQPSHIVLGNYIATSACRYAESRTDVPPVMLIVSWGLFDDPFQSNDTLAWVFNERTAWHTSWDPNKESPFLPATLDRSQELEAHKPTKSRWLISQAYVDSLCQVFECTVGAKVSKEHLLVLSTLPLKHLDTLQLCMQVRLLRDAAKENVYDIGLKRFNIRRHIVESECSTKNLSRYAHTLKADYLLNCQGFRQIEGLWKDAFREARLLEEEVRDHLQLEASFSSLEESRQSIKLSNHQIEESRRGMIPTVF